MRAPNITPGKYDAHQIAREIQATASGQAHYGNALYVALDIPCIVASPEHRIAIQRYLRGSQIATDHIRLQEAAAMIAQSLAAGYTEGGSEA